MTLQINSLLNARPDQARPFNKNRYNDSIRRLGSSDRYTDSIRRLGSSECPFNTISADLVEPHWTEGFRAVSFLVKLRNSDGTPRIATLAYLHQFYQPQLAFASGTEYKPDPVSEQDIQSLRQLKNEIQYLQPMCGECNEATATIAKKALQDLIALIEGSSLSTP